MSFKLKRHYQQKKKGADIYPTAALFHRQEKTA